MLLFLTKLLFPTGPVVDYRNRIIGRPQQKLNLLEDPKDDQT